MLYLTTALHQVPKPDPSDPLAPTVQTWAQREDSAWEQVRSGRWQGQPGEHVGFCSGTWDRATEGREPAVEQAAGPIPRPREGGGLPGRPEGMSTGNGWRMSLGWACLGFRATDSSENPASQGEGVEGHAHIGRRFLTSRVPQRGPPAMGQVHVTRIPPSTAVGGQDLEAVGPVHVT